MYLFKPFQRYGFWGSLTCTLFLCSSCGSNPELPKSDFLSLRPKFDEPVVFKFKNHASRRLMDAQQNLNQDVSNSQIWSSTASGQLELVWSGEVVHEDGGSVISMDYELKNLRWAERDAWEERGWSWSEEIGGDPVVTMKRGGLSRANPMGWMRGDPRDYFLAKKSKAMFWLDGEAFRQNGQLIPAKTLDGPKDTAAIGQYFLSGLPISEWAHRLLVPLPKTKALQDGLKWKRPFLRWYNAPPKALAVHEQWVCHQVGRGLKLEMTVVDRLDNMAGKNMDRPMGQWVFQRQLSVIISPEDNMPIWIKWEESGEWVDRLPSLGGSARPMSAKRHQWSNAFEAERT